MIFFCLFMFFLYKYILLTIYGDEFPLWRCGADVRATQNKIE